MNENVDACELLPNTLDVVDVTVDVTTAVVLLATLPNGKLGLLSGFKPKLNVLPLVEPNENF